ncbi:FAD-dependent oxidoreductase [Lacrimispora sp. 38-1]|uniref:FAD-dependent oxidoreductase n=1 Tax=Lacrimispora sp. 38-1 TaxID=3125778 RepID=UPI003CF116F0
MGINKEGLTGVIITPCQKEYEEARQEWNRAVQKFPVIIVFCSQTSDIQNAVRFARRHGLGIRIRSGGHHYQGYSTGNGVLVIDVSPMKDIHLSDSEKYVVMEGGVRNREVYNYLGEKGYPFPGGTCPTVGAAGYTLGGGWGYSSRFLGLGCDSLKALEMVNYEGKVLNADENCNPDLFWALRGAGGGNFGVVTSLTFKLPPPITAVTLVVLEYTKPGLEEMAGFLEVWQKWLVNLDPRITINASMYNSPEEGLGIFGRGLFYGSAQEAAVILKPFERDGAVLNYRELSFFQAMEIIQSTYPEYEKFQSAGRFVHRMYGAEERRKIVTLIKKRAEGSVYAAVSVYALGGKVREISPVSTAYFYRNASYIMGIQSVWEDDCYEESNRRWLYPRFQYLKGLTEGSYINFPYNRLPVYEKEYYGGNVCRLKQTESRYDPIHVFSFPQAVR